MKHKVTAIAGVVGLSLFLSACNSSSEEEIPLMANATSTGVISGFGSVYVNGVRYVTKDSSIIGNGSESSESALKTGMKVVIQANQLTDNDPTALEVKYLADAIGIIDDIDLLQSSLRILGQSYFITSATSFDETTFNDLRVGMAVELSAFEDEQDSFSVSYLAVQDEVSEYQLLGTVSKLNKIEKTFSVGKLFVNYENADIKGALSLGSKVVLKSEFAPINNELTVDEVAIQGLALVIGGTLTVAGFVNDVNKGNEGITIEVDGREYLLTNESIFSQGNEEALKEGSQVSLIATVTQGEAESDYPRYPINNIRVELANELSLEGIVDSVTDTSFMIFDREFIVDDYTLYEDDSEQELRYFNFADIAIGDKLEIDAYEVDGVLISRNIEREATGASDEGMYDIEGLVDSIDKDLVIFSVKGIKVLTDELTKFEDAQGNKVNQVTFFNNLAVNDEVDVDIVNTESGWLAIEVDINKDEIENEVELLGVIDTFESIKSFTVNGHKIITNMLTEFDNGNAGDLSLNTLVEIEGYVNGEGKLVAQEVEFVDIDVD